MPVVVSKAGCLTRATMRSRAAFCPSSTQSTYCTEERYRLTASSYGEASRRTGRMRLPICTAALISRSVHSEALAASVDRNRKTSHSLMLRLMRAA